MTCHPVLLGNWATAVPRADHAPSWFSATNAHATSCLPWLTYLSVTLPCINRGSPSGLCRWISHVSSMEHAVIADPVRHGVAAPGAALWTVVLGPGRPHFL